jgi:hypothetical protein
MTISKLTLAVALAALCAVATDAAAQSRSGGRQGPNGRGYTYSVTRDGKSVTGSVETNKGYGATLNHSGETGAHGVQYGSTTVTTNNGSSLVTQSARGGGVVAGTATITGPDGQSATRGGAIYVPQ